ncbi:MAG: hypothetical protein KC503_41290 [Myxococcales bacterium]|nr:hypothetical protein [Myxococcales bacterium]
MTWAGVIIFAFIGGAWWLVAAGTTARASGKSRSRIVLRNTTTAAMRLPTYSDRAHGAGHRAAPRPRLTGDALDRFNFVATYHRRMRPRYGLSATAAGPRRDIFRVTFVKKPSAATLDLVTSGSLQLRNEARSRGFKAYQVLVQHKVVWQKKL